jgi:DNA-binding MltR family transcriptional regulator
MEKEFYGGSARSVVILQAAMVEVALEKAIQKKMRKDIPKEVLERLFEYDGPIGNFSSKTTIAYAFGILGTTARHDLDLIRLMRNQFAHCRKAMDFSTPQVAAVCEHLLIPNIAGVSVSPMALAKVVGEKEALDSKNPKTRYICCCFSIANKLLEFAYQKPSAPFTSAIP